MSGWRVQLRKGVARGRSGVAIDTFKPIPDRLCRQCGVVESTKRIHLRLDANDSAIVSDGVLEELEQAGALGTLMRVTNQVVQPPAQTVAVGPRPEGGWVPVRSDA